MEPLTLALKIICQPHLAMIYILEYAQQEEQLQKTYEFKKEISENLSRIHDLLIEEYGPKYELNKANNSSSNRICAQEMDVDHIDAIAFLEFSTANLVSILMKAGPIRINNVLLAQLNSRQECSVPVDMAQLRQIRISMNSQNLAVTFDEVYGPILEEQSNESRGNRSTLQCTH